jgi:hypothetical protein
MIDNKFHIFLSWLRDLGGTFEPVRDLSEKKPLTGRRDPDRKPRQYVIGTHDQSRQYGIKPNGQVIRL